MPPKGIVDASLVLRAGDLVGPYTVTREIGRGAMAIVYEATRAEGKPVALKVLHPEVERQAEIRERFEREGLILQALRHENIARVYDVGTLPNGSRYLVIDLLEGTDLGTMLDNVGRLPIHTAVEYVLGAAQGVGEAHAHGIVHRDLKPANIFLSKNRGGQDVVKVLDFGVAKVLGAVESEEVARQVIGSPHYFSPEQLQGSFAVTPRTDVWALGIVLYKALTDTYPFEGDTMPELCRQIRQGVPRSVRDLQPDCPLALQDILRRCLSKDPAARYANASELAAALEVVAAADAEEAEVTRIQDESTRFMPSARGLQERSAMASITGMRVTDAPSAQMTASTSLVASSLSSFLVTGPTGTSSATAYTPGSFRAVESTTAPHRQAFPWWVAGLVAGLLLLGGTGLAVSVGRTSFGGATTSVKVRVTSQPDGAFFTLDYGIRTIAPGELTVRRDDKAHILTVWKDGFRPETRELSTAADVNVQVKLTPVR